MKQYRIMLCSKNHNSTSLPAFFLVVFIFAFLSIPMHRANAQTISTIAGTGVSGYEDGVATSAKLSAVSNLSVDNLGNIYLADYSPFDMASRIRKITPSGIIGTIAGYGPEGYSGDGGPAVSAQFRGIVAIRPDNLGNLYVADQINHVIRKIDASNNITTVVGNGTGAGTSTGGYSGDGGPATNAQLNQPSDIVIDNSGNLYINDGLNKVIRKVSPSGIITTIAGTGTEGYTGDGGPAAAAKISPYGLAVDNSGTIYFVQAAGSTTTTGHAIRKISPSGIITTICGTGAEGYSGDGGPATAATLRSPSRLVLDPTGNIYVCDQFNYAIRKISTDGIITTIAGTGVAGYSGDGGPATAAKMDFPMAIAIDNANNLYVSDYQNRVVRKITASSTKVDDKTSRGIDFSLCPNPNLGSFYVTGTMPLSKNSVVNVCITNSTGRVVYHSTAYVLNSTITHKVELDNNLANGVYLIEVFSEDQKVTQSFSLIK
jgi:hypothetical protein